jgi:hypothetical protein
MYTFSQRRKCRKGYHTALQDAVTAWEGCTLQCFTTQSQGFCTNGLEHDGAKKTEADPGTSNQKISLTRTLKKYGRPASILQKSHTRHLQKSLSHTRHAYTKKATTYNL